MINEKIFKAYDVRAIYGSELTDEAAYAIGRAFAQYINAKTIAIGRDNRESSPTLFREVTRGIQDAGVDVIDLDIVTTPMVYYASTILPVEGAVIVTASHSPKEYNGMKLAHKNAIHIGIDTGLSDIKDIAMAEDFLMSEKIGSMRAVDIKEPFYNKLLSFADMGESKFTIVTDTANAVGAIELEIYRSLSSNITLHTLFEEMDSEFPNHEANPHKAETLVELQNEVLAKKADIGVAYDGDADRVGFVDDNGTVVTSDVIFAIIARELLAKNPGSTLLYDLRSTKAIAEIIEGLGGVAHESPIGGPKIKKQMREEQALAAAELTGHFNYKEMSYAESSTLTVILLLNVLGKTNKKLSELASEVRKYHHSGEINFTVSDASKVLATLQETYAEGAQKTNNGFRVRYDDWWFLLRISNTEPVIRLVVEADTQELLEEKKTELVAQIEALA